jgi:hypothetical protein
LELPFLRLKQQSLRQQLKKTEEDICFSHRKLLTAIADCTYEAFEEKMRSTKLTYAFQCKIPQLQ